MDRTAAITCCGCLNNGRRMVEISENDLRKCFSEIINENLISNYSSQLLQLCFECTALLLKFTKFKMQVAASYKTFQSYAQQCSSFNKPITRLCMNELTYIHIDTLITSQNKDLTEISADNVKVENDTDDVLDDDNVLDIDDIKEENYSEPERMPSIKTKKKKKKQKIKLEKDRERECTGVTLNQREIDHERTNLALRDGYDDAMLTCSKCELTFPNEDDLNDHINVKHEQTKKKKKKHNGELENYIEQEFIEVTLSEKEIQEERVMLSLRDEYVNAMFTCDKCILTFPNKDDLNDHVLVKHEQNAPHYKCAICTCSFSSEVSYNYHTNKHTRRYQCTACVEKFTSKHAATKHYSLTHRHGAAIEYELVGNNMDITDQNAVEESEKDIISNPEEKSFPCEFCSKIFKWKTSLRKHVEKHRIDTGEKRKPYCAPCRLTFSTTPNLQKHVRTSSKHKIQLKLRKLNEISEANETEENQKQSKKKTQLMEEIKSSVSNTQTKYFCHQCDKVFLWRGNLYRHMQSHAAKAKGDLVCKPCNRTFSSIATYQQHMKISKKHVSEDDFKYMCSECGKRFPTKSHLRDHINWEHLKNFVYSCVDCNKVFKTSNSMYLHKQAVHNRNDVEHLCDHCGKPFPNNAKLRNHILGSHSGGALLQCRWCDARFSWHSCLSRHVRQKHRYMCSECGKRFPTKSHLRDHINWEHLKNFVYSCVDCNKVFKTSNSMYLHKQAVHNRNDVEHLCDHCGKPFPNNAKLRNHILGSHSGGALLQCRWCDARFSWHSCLSRHVRQKHRKVTSKMSEQ